MVGIAKTDHAYAVLLRAGDGLSRCRCGQHLTHPIVTIDQGQSTGVHQVFGPSLGMHHARFDSCGVP